jgi:hypothetical protein
MNEDRLLSILLRQGTFRDYRHIGRDMVEEARRIIPVARLHGGAGRRSLWRTAMMASQLKHESESLTTNIPRGRPCGNLVCTGRYGGLVKGLYR